MGAKATIGKSNNRHTHTNCCRKAIDDINKTRGVVPPHRIPVDAETESPPSTVTDGTRGGGGDGVCCYLRAAWRAKVREKNGNRHVGGEKNFYTRGYVRNYR